MAGVGYFFYYAVCLLYIQYQEEYSTTELDPYWPCLSGFPVTLSGLHGTGYLMGFAEDADTFPSYIVSFIRIQKPVNSFVHRRPSLVRACRSSHGHGGPEGQMG